MDTIYQTISRAINIDREREKYTAIYNTVRDLFINALRENEIFNVLFCDLRLSGSYPDNLKVSKPDEFDLVIRLKFPNDHLVKIHPDASNLGSVYIDLSNVLAYLGKSENTRMRTFLKRMVSEKGYFLLDRFQSWLEGRFENFLTSRGRVLRCYDGTYLLTYSKNGPAHTIGVTKDCIKLSIDFVPGFHFENNISISPRKSTTGYWEAIPRPHHGTNNNPSFKCSYADSERSIIANKYNLKQAARLMKKFRDMNPKMKTLKSYYIKTLFLWHDVEVGSHFWKDESITTVLHTMFEKLEIALRDQRINWFWNKKVNLLQDLRPSQIESMYNEVKNTRKMLLYPKSANDTLNIFLTKEEQRRMTPDDKEDIKESFASISKPVASSVGALVAGAGLYLLYKLFK